MVTGIESCSVKNARKLMYQEIENIEVQRQVTGLLREILKKENAKNEGFLFHYTSTLVLNAILENAVFWASNLFYLNDAMEYKHGIKAISELDLYGDNQNNNQNKMKELVTELNRKGGNNFKGVYSISFSGEEDGLHQWITYAKDSGVCIALDKNDLMSEGEDNQRKFECYFWNEFEEKENRRNARLYTSVEEERDLVEEEQASVEEEQAELLTKYEEVKNIISPVYYIDNGSQLVNHRNTIINYLVKAIHRSNEIKQQEGGDTLNREANNGEATNQGEGIQKSDPVENVDLYLEADNYVEYFFRVFCTYLKTEAFYQESEYRMVFHFPDIRKTPKVKYQSRQSGILRPYIEITFQDNSRAEVRPCLPVRGILVGPSGRQQAVFDSVVHRLRYGENKVFDYVEAWADSEVEWSKSKLKKIFDAYCEGVKNDLVNWKIDEKQLKKFLFCEWLETIRENDLRISAKTMKYIKKLESAFAREVEEKKGKCNQPEMEGSDFSQVIDFIRQNHFLSKEGIWVRKSKIPYIFND